MNNSTHGSWMCMYLRVHSYQYDDATPLLNVFE